MELTSWQRQAARQYFTDHQLAPPYDHELDALASILQYHPEPQEKKHGYGCACADCGREREDRKASDRQDCETSEMTEEAKAANRAMIAEMDSETLEALTEKMAVVLMEPDEDQRSEFQRRADLANVHSFTERNA